MHELGIVDPLCRVTSGLTKRITNPGSDQIVKRPKTSSLPGGYETIASAAAHAAWSDDVFRKLTSFPDFQDATCV